MPIHLVTPPLDEPVTVAEVKTDLRVDEDFLDHDDLIEGYISAGRMYAETVCRRCFMLQSWRITADRFPSPMAGRLTEYWLGQGWGLAGMGGVSEFPLTDKTGYGFRIPFSPLVSIDSIQYVDPAGAWQTLSVDAYKVDADSEPARILPAFGKAWPTTRQEIGAVKLNLTAGYANAAAVPQGIKLAIKMYVKAHYDAGFDGGGSSNEYERRMAAVDNLLSPYRVFTFA